jgi:hypothetical protein
MPKMTTPFTRGDYAPVAERIALFYARHPEGRIVTELVERGEAIIFKALAYRTASDALPAATGWASERVGDGEINAVACLENTETSAIGRALANLGFTASSRRPSAEEMLKAARERARQIAERRVGRGPMPAGRERAAHGGAPRLVQDPEPDFWPTDPLILDVLELLFEAERVGLDRRRSNRLRHRLASGGLRATSAGRIERVLRRWLAERDRLV